MRVCCKIRFKLSYLVKLYILNCILYYSLEFFKSHFGFILQDNKLFFAFSLLSLRFLYYLPFSIFHAHRTHIHTCIHSSFPSIFASRPVSLLTVSREFCFSFPIDFGNRLDVWSCYSIALTADRSYVGSERSPSQNSSLVWSAAGGNSLNEFASRSWRTVIRHFHLHYKIVSLDEHFMRVF